MTVNEFYETLQKYKVKEPFDRQNHCYLVYIKESKPHIFQVRAWKDVKEDSLNISVVNWTLCAGPASLTINNANINKFVIIPDESEVYKLKALMEGQS